MSKSAIPVGAPPRTERAPIPPDRCGAVLASELLGDRWTLQIIREAFYGVRRFADYRADLGIPTAALSNRLLRLAEAGVLSKVEYRSGTERRRYEYVLTHKGMDLVFVLVAMMEWGDRHMTDGTAPVRLIDKKSGKQVTLGFVPVSQGGVPPAQVRMEATE